MPYKLNLGAWNNVFAIPASVVDNYIKLAGGNNLKVLLFVLRNAGFEITVDTISEKTGVKPEDVNDALLFWEQTGLLVLNENNEILPAKDSVKTEKPVKSESYERIEQETGIQLKKIELSREPRFYPKDIAHAVRNNQGMNFLFKECERIFGRVLKHNEQNTLMVMTEENGIPAECVLMLVEYCFSVNKATPSYMKAIAVDWLERGILSINAAEEEIKVLREFNNLENNLKRLFEMNNAFSKVQKDFIRKWNKLGYEEDMLSEAYQITLNATGKMAFPYMDKVIEGWNTEGIKNKEQFEKSLKTHKEKTQKQKQTNSSFDLDKISKIIDEN